MRDWPPSRRPRYSPVARWLLRGALAAVLFVLGLAVGAVLDDNPDPERSPSQTLERTLGPLPLSAPPTVTVTVTEPAP